jgi:hypothetical protein
MHKRANSYFEVLYAVLFYLFELIFDDFISVSLPDTCQPGGLECA